MPRRRTDEVAEATGRLASVSRWAGPDSDEAVDARRNLEAAKLERHVREAVAGWPPLSDTQKARIAALLGGTTTPTVRGELDVTLPTFGDAA